MSIKVGRIIFYLKKSMIMLNHIKYRLYYDGYPMFDHYSLTMMKQAWKNQVLFEYERPLIQIGNLLNSQEVELPSGEKLLSIC